MIINIFAVKDRDGGTVRRVTENTKRTVSISVVGEDGLLHVFEGRVFHLEKWCKARNLPFATQTIEVPDLEIP